MLWTDAKIERLIELYRSFEFLYNPKLRDHKNRIKAQLAWQTIGDDLAATASSSSAMFSRWKLVCEILTLFSDFSVSIFESIPELYKHKKLGQRRHSRFCLKSGKIKH